MPADSPGVPSAGISSAFDQRRRSERRPCSLAVRLETPHGEVQARLNDVSVGGFGFSADHLLALRPGNRLRVISPHFGEIACVVRWAAPPRHGAQVIAGSSSLGRLKAFYDGLPRARGDIL